MSGTPCSKPAAAASNPNAIAPDRPTRGTCGVGTGSTARRTLGAPPGGDDFAPRPVVDEDAEMAEPAGPTA
ncbi:MAG TPA: hypothetical protein VF069_01860 [Streptosporangiaceae bacterium]